MKLSLIHIWSGRNGSGIERVDELLDERFFHISVESEKTDEGEKLEKIPVLFRRVLEGLFGDGGFFLYILPELGELVLFQTEHFLINVQMCIRDRTKKEDYQKALDLLDAEGYKILE